MVEPHRENEYMYASYWVTHCTLANNLRPGLILTSPKNAMVQKGALTLLTNTIGGEEQQRGMDAVQAYRFALTTRDRIITVEDIKNFCRMELRGQAKEIHVKKGTAISQKPKEGFIRTLEITIIPRIMSCTPKPTGTAGQKYWYNKLNKGQWMEQRTGFLLRKNNNQPDK